MSYIRQRGAGDYENSGNWTWEHWPPPFDHWAPTNSAVQPSPVLGGGGLGCASGDGGCGCPANTAGLGQTGLLGTGLFAGGLNPSTWGIGEWSVVAVGGFLTVKLLGSNPTIQRSTKKAKRGASAATSGIGTIVLYGALAYGAWWAYSNYGTQLGLGDYQPQGWVTPQVLSSPGKNSQLLIPVGW